MSYRVFASPSGERAFKKLPPRVRATLKEAIHTLKTYPDRGEQLKGKLAFLRSLHVSYQGVQYRIIYEVNEAEQEILIHYMASRENLYREVERLKLKPFGKRAA